MAKRLYHLVSGVAIDGPEFPVSIPAAGRFFVANIFTTNYSGSGKPGAYVTLRDQPAGGGNIINGGSSGGTIQPAGGYDTQQMNPGNPCLDGGGQAISYDPTATLYATVQSVGTNHWPAGSTCDLYIEYVDLGA